MKDPWLENLMKDPDVRAKISLFLSFLQIIILIMLIAGLIVFVVLLVL
jgi:hypothetical protein